MNRVHELRCLHAVSIGAANYFSFLVYGSASIGGGAFGQARKMTLRSVSSLPVHHVRLYPESGHVQC